MGEGLAGGRDVKQPDGEVRIDVLDRGYVRLVDHMGSDLNAVNAARASYMKEKHEFDEKDERLIRFMATAHPQHTSPFRQATLQFEIKAPLFTARQWFKYRIGSVHSPDTAEILGVELPREVVSWLGLTGDDGGLDDPLYARNEASRRYVTLPPEFYVPDGTEWRSRPASSKQGSGDPVGEDIGAEATRRLRTTVERGLSDYEWALSQGICAEQARLFLPAYGLYTTWRWTASLAAVAHFLNQRLEEDAQKEIQMYAAAVYAVTAPLFPVSMKYLVEHPPK